MTTKVTPFIGFLGELNVSKLRVMSYEVSKVFTIPIHDLLLNGKNVKLLFRGHLIETKEWKVPDSKLKIWGLTAYFLDKALSHIICPMNHRM